MDFERVGLMSPILTCKGASSAEEKDSWQSEEGIQSEEMHLKAPGLGKDTSSNEIEEEIGRLRFFQFRRAVFPQRSPQSP